MKSFILKITGVSKYVEGLCRTIEEKNDKIADLSTRLSCESLKNNDISQRCLLAEKKLVVKEQIISGQKDELESFKADITKQREYNQSLLNTIKEYTSEKTKLRDELKQEKANVDSLSAKLGKTEKLLTSLRSELDTCKAERYKQRDEIVMLRSELEEANALITSLQDSKKEQAQPAADKAEEEKVVATPDPTKKKSRRRKTT